MANTKRLLELAVKGLELERRQIDGEIADIRKQLRGGGMRAPARTPLASAPSPQPAKAAQKKSRLTAAGRKALSDAMKRRWAVKKKAGMKGAK